MKRQAGKFGTGSGDQVAFNWTAYEDDRGNEALRFRMSGSLNISKRGDTEGYSNFDKIIQCFL